MNTRCRTPGQSQASASGRTTLRTRVSGVEVGCDPGRFALAEAIFRTDALHVLKGTANFLKCHEAPSARMRALQRVSPMSDTCIRFGRFDLMAAARQLLVDGTPVAIGGRAFDLLLTLVENRGRVVSKAELMDHVWPGLAVIDNNLSAQIAALRRTLGRNAILTVSGRGYRFVLDVAPATALPGARVPQLEGPSIAVLPFLNLSGDPSQDYFADGMADDIITALSKFKQFLVISRNSSFAYRDRAADVLHVGRELGVRYVLSGSVRRSAERLRIAVQLVETERSLTLWAETCEGNTRNLFDLQDEITAQCAAAIEPAILATEIERARRKHPESLAAYDLRMRALPHLYAMRPDANDTALPFLEQALAIDPCDASTLAHLAWCYEQRLSRGWPNAAPGHRATAASMARRALAVGSDDSSAIGLAGFVMVAIGDDAESGLAAVRRAAGANPNHALIRILAGTAELIAGGLDEAISHLERARRLSPHDPGAFMITTALACAHLFAGLPRVALALCIESVVENPEWDFTWWVLAAAAGESGELSKAHEAFTNLGRIASPEASEYPRFRTFTEERRGILFKALNKAGFAESEIELPIWLGD